jgi:hypothetical protein
MTPESLALAKMGIGVGGDILSGFLGGMGTESMGDELIRAQKQQQGYLDRSYDEASDLYRPIQQQGMEGFNQLASGVLSGEFARPDMPEFQYDKTAMDFLDPSRAFQQAELLRGLEGSQAFGGKLKSGASMEALQDRFQDRAMTDYSNAYGRMTGDRDFSYQDYTNQFNNTVNQVNDRYNKLSKLASAGTSATGDLASLRMGQGRSQAQTAGAIGDVNAQMSQVPYMNLQNIVGGAQNMGGSLLGAYGKDKPQTDQTPQIPSNINQIGLGGAGAGAPQVSSGNLGASIPFPKWQPKPSHSWGP